MSESIIDDGGPVYPGQWADFQPTTGDQVVREQWTGISLRDWFAGQALAQIGNEYVARGEVTRQAQEHAMALAAHAYNIADAMIAARKGGAK